MINRPNAYLDSLLLWENRDVLHRKIYREDIHPSMSELPFHVDPATGQAYFTFSWAAGKAPPSEEIAVSVDYFPPPESGLEYPVGTELHNHDFFEIVYVYSGEILSTISGRERTLKAGDICLYNLQALHKLQKQRRGDVVFNVLIRQDLFRRSFLDLLAENDMITSFFLQSIYNIHNGEGMLLLHPDARYHSEPLSQQMVEMYFRDEPMSQSLIKALLILLFGEMTRQYRDEFAEAGDGVDPQRLLLPEVMAYLNRHYDDVKLEQLAAHFGYSSRSMVRFLNRATGATFKEIVQHLRFQQACAYLRDEAMAIHDIAAKIGYRERSSFDRAFKQRYLISPVEYRRRYQ